MLSGRPKAILNPKIVVLGTAGTRDPAVLSVCPLALQARQTAAICLGIEYRPNKWPFLLAPKIENVGRV